MTEIEIKLAVALGEATFPVGHYHKRFARDMRARAELRPQEELTTKQRVFLKEMVTRYRRQIPAGLVAAAQQL